MRFLALIITFVCSLSSFAEYRFTIATEEQVQRLSSELSKLESILPESVVSVLKKKTISFEIKKLPKNYDGFANKNDRIQLSEDLFADPSEALLRALVHETAHLYDYMGFVSKELNEQILLCRKILAENMSPRSTSKRPVPMDCDHTANIKHSVSDHTDFLRAAFWPRIGFINNAHYERGNFLTSRSPDPYEYKNSREAFAVNFEYFILDPEFKCRKPSLYSFFVNRFQYQPFAGFSCSNTSSVLVSGGSVAGGLNNIEQIDFNRVYAIHYLFAGKGNSMMSKYGHAMIRLVICAPSRRQLSEECVKDISHHRVISFRASVGDFTIDTLKGLGGDYPSILFILPLVSVIDEYTRRELREVVSYPLKLSREEIARFLRSMMEMHWSYQGKYYFFGNNCAVETMNLLKLTLPDFAALQRLSLITPTGLRDELLKIGLAEGSQQKNQKAAIADGYYFQSKRVLLEASLKQIKEVFPEYAKMKLEDMVKMSSSQRRQIFESIENKDLKITAAFLAIEEKAYLQIVNRVFSEAVKKVRGEVQEIDANSEQVLQIGEDLQEARNMMSLFSAPGSLLQPNFGYGIPSQAEVQALLDNSQLQEKSKESEEVRKNIENNMRTIVPDALTQELMDSENFRRALSGHLKVLLTQQIKR